jgi:hypothetical protein
VLLGDIDLPAEHGHGGDQPTPIPVALHQPQELALKAVLHRHRPVHRLGFAQPGRLVPILAATPPPDVAELFGLYHPLEPVPLHHQGLRHTDDEHELDAVCGPQPISKRQPDGRVLCTAHQSLIASSTEGQPKSRIVIRGSICKDAACSRRWARANVERHAERWRSPATTP